MTVDVTPSSGNVFADLGLPNPEERLLKAKVSLEILRLIEARGLTQKEAGELLGLPQPKVSALVNGHLSGFSMERLLRFLAKLGQRVDIVIQPAEGAGSIQVEVKTACESERQLSDEVMEHAAAGPIAAT